MRLIDWWYILRKRFFSGFKKGKYGAVKTTIDGISFASKCEAGLYNLLKSMESRKEIYDIECQSNVYMTDAKILFKVDFKMKCANTGEEIWAEAKGAETAVYRIKRRLWVHYGTGVLKVYKCYRGIPGLFETITPKKNNDHDI